MLLPAVPRAYPVERPLAPVRDSQLCVHTRLIDEVFEWKIQKSLELTREMGATTIVEFFPWAYFEGTGKGQYQWERADMILQHAHGQGLRVIARLGFVPEWAQPDTEETDATLNYLPETSFADFADFAGVFAERYADEVDAIIIWNEPNLAFEWGFRDVDPEGYTELLRLSYHAIKERNPAMVVLGGALAPTLEPEGSPNGLNDLLYLERMYQANAQAYMDGLAVHTYGLAHPADTIPAPEYLNFRRVELLRALQMEYGIEQPLYITETGWNDHPRWTNAVTPGERAQYTINALEMAESWAWLETMCLWVLRYPADTFSYPDYYTLITPDFRLKPIYYAVQAYAQQTDDFEPLWLPPPELDEVGS
jgi:hypothetical protein